ncbi:helix-turn-helix domain-containing protein [Solirubrobacter ginsenosidimutans]|uniref:Helix-turn-helix domain-containing protein n=1 Tax=Solirubrobacter ginsenosidimutans TaxID=490573 RepID=A0A9X3RZ86_9ACTN|nr:helix-turn-helix domain-containing protein [Solirubrobacter ginsenosidimutans]MDA0160665.1 helix-turn-helix domain-containing protein [Solirubrobacter ginsenosidimutans]
MTIRAGAPEQIRALATVTLDAQALDELGPQTIDRLADLVAQRLAERNALEDDPLLSAQEAGRVAAVHPETVRRAVRSGALPVAGYVGQRPRLRRADIDAWIARDETQTVGRHRGSLRRNRSGTSGERVLGNALRAVSEEVRG